MSPNTARSVKDRLLNRARKTGEDLNTLLNRYWRERFLYRLGVSSYQGECILKGGALLALWFHEPHRATQDVDFLAFGSPNEDRIRALVRDVCTIPCPQDGVRFDTSTLRIDPIRGAQEYTGMRARLDAYLGEAKGVLQLDFGFGDAVRKPDQAMAYPALLQDIPVPEILAYPRSYCVAEKFDAMVLYGRNNTRMKDFHDVWALAQTFSFKGPELQRAVVECFKRRRRTWQLEPPEVLRSEFYTDDVLQRCWIAYLNREDYAEVPPDSFQRIGDTILDFLGPVRRAILEDDPFLATWPSGGPWGPNSH